MPRNMQGTIARELERLEAEGCLRSIPDIDRGSDLYLDFQGKTLLNLASNNYLGLAGSNALSRAAVQAVENFGTSSGASRLIAGNYDLLTELEHTLSRFKKTSASLIMNSGYAANLGLISSLADRKSLVFSDRLNHASIIDGIQLSRATHVRYRHGDPEHLSHQLQKYPEQCRKILITDTVFSMDGDKAPLVEIVDLCKEHQVLIIVDEAHAAGILGQGRGLAAELGLEQEIDVHMGTFSKALGSFGGYIAGSQELIRLVQNKARSFIFSTALPPAVIGANLEALHQVQIRPDKGAHLLNMAQDLRKHLHSLGWDTLSSTTQIVPVIVGSNQNALDTQKKLMDRGIYAAAVRPPTVPRNLARIRLSLRADMQESDMALLKQAWENPGEPC